MKRKLLIFCFTSIILLSSSLIDVHADISTTAGTDSSYWIYESVDECSSGWTKYGEHLTGNYVGITLNYIPSKPYSFTSGDYYYAFNPNAGFEDGEGNFTGAHDKYDIYSLCKKLIT